MFFLIWMAAQFWENCMENGTWTPCKSVFNSANCVDCPGEKLTQIARFARLEHGNHNVQLSMIRWHSWVSRGKFSRDM